MQTPWGHQIQKEDYSLHILFEILIIPHYLISLKFPFTSFLFLSPFLSPSPFTFPIHFSFSFYLFNSVFLHLFPSLFPFPFFLPSFSISLPFSFIISTSKPKICCLVSKVFLKYFFKVWPGTNRIEFIRVNTNVRYRNIFKRMITLYVFFEQTIIFAASQPQKLLLNQLFQLRFLLLYDFYN